MKLQNAILINENFAQALGKLANSKIPALAAFNIFKIIKVLETEGAVIQETKNSLIKKYGKADAKGDISVSMEDDKENFKIFMDSFNEILKEEFELPIKEKLKIVADNIKDSKDEPVLFTVPEIANLSEIIDFE